MNGIENITQRIEQQTQAEVEQILSAARDNAAQISARYQAQAQREAAEAAIRSEKAAAEREDRLVSVAQMEARKVALAAKQEMVEQAFTLALDQLCSQPDESYIQTAVHLLVQAAPDGCGSVIFAPAQRQSIGEAVVAQANARLGEQGKLTLSDETRPLQGGFILKSGDVEINCTFETLVRLQRGVMAGEAAKLLFDQT